MSTDHASADEMMTPALPPQVAGLAALARRLGVDLNRQVLNVYAAAGRVEPAAMVRSLEEAGVRARAVRSGWQDLLALARSGTPTLLLLEDGGAAILEGASADGTSISLSDPAVAGHEPPGEVDEFRLRPLWTGVAIIAWRRTGDAQADAPLDMRRLLNELFTEKELFRDIGIATVVLSFIAVAPPMIMMAIMDRVIVYQSWTTLTLITVLLVVFVAHETLLGYAQRALIALASARIDGRLSLFAMQRLLRLPQDYFEQNQAGFITGKIHQIGRVREFLTGHLFRIVLDLMTLVVLLPILFFLQPFLAMWVLIAATLIGLIIFLFLPAIGRAHQRVTAAENKRSSTLIETIQGMRTVKVLALEPRQAEEWNRNTADATEARLHLLNLANWPQTLTTPLDRFMTLGLLLLGSFMILQGDPSTLGGLFAFFMLAGRAAAPLISLASLTQSYAEAQQALGEAGSVLNQPPERPATQSGVQPKLLGQITVSDLTFQYPKALAPALEDISFEVPAGTLLGLVGRSGSGKSTITRILQGISTGYSGLVKLDGIELREIDLQHLRRSLGVVLQENFLFRGSIRENIVAGRAGISFEKVIRACRLAGAEEFIERLPRGYDTFIEEGSPNLSGGQRQRLAIARAIVVDPPLLILDEATSALDPESEALVNANLRRMARGRTVIVVSHRLSTLVDADKIIVLDRGRMVDFAPHDVLVTRCEAYRTLWQQQRPETGKVDHA